LAESDTVNYIPESSSQDSLLARYLTLKKSTFFSTYTHETMNSILDPEWKFAFQAGLFLLFYDMNMTLASFGKQNLADKIMFLQRLKPVLDGSASQSLGPTAIVSIMDWVREQYFGECFGRQDMVLKEVDLCTYGTNALKLFNLLNGPFRVRMTAALRAWVLCDVNLEVNWEKDDLNEADFAAMEEQVTQAWWREHLTSKASPSPSLSPER